MKLKYDKLLSNFAFNCKLRHYTMDTTDTDMSDEDGGGGRGGRGRGGGGGGRGGGGGGGGAMMDMDPEESSLLQLSPSELADEDDDADDADLLASLGNSDKYGTRGAGTACQTRYATSSTALDALYYFMRNGIFDVAGCFCQALGGGIGGRGSKKPSATKHAPAPRGGGGGGGKRGTRVRIPPVDHSLGLQGPTKAQVLAAANAARAATFAAAS